MRVLGTLVLIVAAAGCSTSPRLADGVGADRVPFEVWTTDAALDVYVGGENAARREAAARLVATGEDAAPAIRRRLHDTREPETRQRLLALLDELGALPVGTSDADRVDLLFWTFRQDGSTASAHRLARLADAPAGVRAEIRRRASSGGAGDRALALYLLAWTARSGAPPEEVRAILAAAARDDDLTVRQAAEAGLQRLERVVTARRLAALETEGKER